jgi:hypothetical protein
MESICPIHQIDYSKSIPLETENIRICKKCAEKLEKEIKNEN